MKLAAVAKGYHPGIRRVSMDENMLILQDFDKFYGF
jgi:hypothetical protein